MKLNTIYQGDCIEVMKKIDDNFIDAIITDPPYGLTNEKSGFHRGKKSQFTRLAKGGFMGKKWDGTGIEHNVDMWRECLRVLKPGGYLLSFGGTRTHHRMACAIEDAGFEIRDMIAWIYGSGFPKSLNIGKAVDKLQGRERKTVREYETHDIRNAGLMDKKGAMTVTETKGTSEWEGWGTALKPALEPICVARKPLSEKTVAENCLKWGTGGINIDGSRVEYTETNEPIPQLAQGKTKIKTDNKMYGGSSYNESKTKSTIGGSLSGRFPANFILSYPENEYIIREDITLEQKEKALKWIYENAKYTMSDMQEATLPKAE